MFETIIVPSQASFLFSLPEQFVGKKIKVLMYSEDEVFPVVEEKPISKAAQFRGMLNMSKEQVSAFHQYVENSRNEWERDI
jgi:hypothetical protein